VVVDRVGDQPAQHHIIAAQQLAQGGGWDRPVAAQLGGMIIGAGQGGGAHRHIDPHRNPVGAGDPGDAFDEGVGHQMVQGFGVAVGFHTAGVIIEGVPAGQGVFGG
jgi:hypothetical protein